jgi:hypothetical protein
VDEGKLPEPQLPGAYSVAYQLAILTENELLLARERNLIRPNVRRSEVLTFRREIMGQTAIHGDLRQELRKLKGRQQSLQRELAEIQLRIEKIESLLAP